MGRVAYTREHTIKLFGKIPICTSTIRYAERNREDDNIEDKDIIDLQEKDLRYKKSICRILYIRFEVLTLTQKKLLYPYLILLALDPVDQKC